METCWKCGGDGVYCWTCGEREHACECQYVGDMDHQADGTEKNIGECDECNGTGERDE